MRAAAWQPSGAVLGATGTGALRGRAGWTVHAGLRPSVGLHTPGVPPVQMMVSLYPHAAPCRVTEVRVAQAGMPAESVALTRSASQLQVQAKLLLLLLLLTEHLPSNRAVQAGQGLQLKHSLGVWVDGLVGACVLESVTEDS